MFSKNFLVEYQKITFKALDDLEEEREKHKITKEKLKETSIELSHLKRSNM